MSERSLILMGGAPGSGTSRLGSALEQLLSRDGVSAEHISTGNRVRHIGAGIVHSVYISAVLNHLNTRPHAPLDDEVIYGIVNEALDQHGGRDLILLDGYPRLVFQIPTIEELALKEDRRLSGLLVTTINTELSIVRMIKRGQKHPGRALSVDEAISRLAEHSLTFPQVIDGLRERGVPLISIDTDDNKETTDQLGLMAVNHFLRGTLPPNESTPGDHQG